MDFHCPFIASEFVKKVPGGALNTIIHFLIVAFAVFLPVKAVSALRRADGGGEAADGDSGFAGETEGVGWSNHA